MPTYTFTAPDGKTYDINGPEGSTKAQAFELLQQQLQSQPPSTQNAQPVATRKYSGLTDLLLGNTQMSPSDRLKDIGSGFVESGKKTARNILEGVGNTVDFIGSPLAVPMAMMGHDPRGGGKALSDYMGLPNTAPGAESVIGEGQKVVAGAGSLLGLSGAGSQLAQGIPQKVMQSMAARPDIQLSSAVGAGLSGGTAKEMGYGPLAQFAASLGGGLAAPLAMSGAQKAYNFLSQTPDKLKGSPQLTSKIEETLSGVLKDKGMSLGDISANVKDKLIEDMQTAMKKGGLTPDTINRLVDYRITGATPTAGPLSLDPGIISKQKNLAKIGVNSNDPRLQALSQIENKNNQKLIENLNDLGASTSKSNLDAGQNVISTLAQKEQIAKAKIDTLYGAARATDGRSAMLDPSKFTNRASDLLDEALLGSKLPADVKNTLNKISAGEIPLTVDVAEQLKTRMGALQRASSDNAERMAIGLVRKSLEETPLLPGQDIGDQSIKAFNAARSANKQWMDQVEKIPALKAVIDGVEPDKFINRYIISGTDKASLSSVKELRNAIPDNSSALTSIKDNLAQYLKQKALSGAADEVGNFSQSGYNKAYNSISEEKLKLFFDKKELSVLRAVGKVASYEQFQPKGSAVNNSNTAGAVISNVLDSISGSRILRGLPLGESIVTNPAANISAGMQAGKMTAISTIKPTKEMLRFPPALWPYLLAPKNNGENK